MLKLLKDIIRWLYWFPMRRVVQRLPHPYVILLGKFIGLAVSFLRRQHLAIICKEFNRFPELSFTHQELKRIAIGSLVAKYQTSLETLLFPLMDEKWITEHCRILNRNHIDEALSQGHGAIILVAHLGPNQMSIPMLGYLGYSVNQLGARPETWHQMVGHQPNRIEQAIFALRQCFEESLPARFLYIDKSMRPVFRCLERNELLIMAFEGRGGAKWMDIELLGRKAAISPGPFFIANRIGAKVLPCFTVRSEDGRIDLHIKPPIAKPELPDKQEAMKTQLHHYSTILGNYIKKYPGQYGALLLEAALRADFDETPLFKDVT